MFKICYRKPNVKPWMSLYFIAQWRSISYLIISCIKVLFFSQNHWGCELRPSARIPNTRKQTVSETGSVSVFRSKRDTYSVGLLRKNKPHSLDNSCCWSWSYDWWSVGQSVLMSGSQPEHMTRFFFSVWRFQVSWCGGTLSDENMDLQFTPTIASGPCQSSHSWEQVPQNSRPYFTASFEISPTLKARSPYAYPQEQGGPVIPIGIKFSLRHLLRIAGLRWRYSNPPPSRIDIL
jgi:hypothetical protein